MKKTYKSKWFLSLAMVFTLLTGLAVPAPYIDTVQAQTTVVSSDYTSTGKMRNVMYYGDWSIWGGQGNFYPAGIPADQLTHLNFAFLDFDKNGNLIFCDKDAATGAPVGMPGVTWGDANAGILSAMQQLRAENPNLRIGISLGGWSKSGDFSEVAANESSRKAFVSNAVKFVKYTNMDFIDLDWEYPGANQRRPGDLVDNKNDEGTLNASAADKANYIALLQEFRTQLDAQGALLGKTYELTVALPAPAATLNDGIDIAKLFSIVDFANIMTYDMRGAWNEVSGHQTNLYTNPDDPMASSKYSVDDSVQYLLANGAPANKIVIGAAFYTRGWQNVSKGTNTALPGLFQPAAPATKDADNTPSRGALNEAPIKYGEGGRCGGVWGYGSLNKLKAAYPGLKEYWDDTAKAPYLYNESNGAFFTYDNQRSIKEKAAYVKANNLGGMISWMASQDAATSTGKRDELTKTIKEALFGSVALTQYNISNAPIDVTVSVETYKEEWSQSTGYKITIKNNAKANESGEVLTLVELAGETVKLPKLYLKTKSGAALTSGGYGTGTVTNQNGICILDLSSVYDNRAIKQGTSISFQLKASNTADLADIESIELAQRITSSGVEISKQTVYKGIAVVQPDLPEIPPTEVTTGSAVTLPIHPKETVSPNYVQTQIYTGSNTVTYEGNTYRCKWWTQGDLPGSPNGPWELVLQ